ncbi:MAG: peptidylprolyl isomerase [Bacteroidales bacterium]|nr:peptidylprolyl isomerase [Bacteroidales bacterium]
MKISWLKIIFLNLIIIVGIQVSIGQEPLVVDRIVAKVGDKIILQSDIENQTLQFMAQGMGNRKDLRCRVLRELLVQKLLLTQAEIDSIEVGPNQVESELTRRLNYFIRQVGSKQKLEEFYNKSILEIQNDFRPLIAEQIKTQMMQADIVSDIDASPKDVQRYYKKLAKDSIPLVNTQYQIKQIMVYPPENEVARNQARKKLLDIRQRIIDGERFSTLAVLYSQDPGSARRGGELGFMTRDELDPAFAKAAFSLSNDGGISRIVESEYGFHIIQLISREDDQVNVRHILIIPKIQVAQKVASKAKLDSISDIILSDSLTFEQAAIKYSKDKKSRFNKALMLNEENTSTKFQLDKLPKAEYSIVKDLKLGEVSSPFESVDSKRKTVFKIIKIDKIIEAHRANLEDDYDLIKNMSRVSQEQMMFEDWLKEKKAKTYIFVDKSFFNCEFLKEEGWLK